MIYEHTEPTLTLEEVKQLIRESELRMIETINSIQPQHEQETPNPPGTPLRRMGNPPLQVVAKRTKETKESELKEH